MSGPPWTPAGDVQKIFDHIRVEDSGCWTWTGTTLPSGVGRIRWEGQQTAVHRIAYELFVGPIAEGMHLDHVCHNADPAYEEKRKARRRAAREAVTA
jgi:hypothetical protein